MKILKTALLLLIISVGSIHVAQSQVTVGMYSNGILHQVGVGTNPENKFFGEARILAGDYYNRLLGVEAIGQISIKRSDWHNISGGLMVGYGMARSGNCGFGAIARLGGGDMRAFVIVLVMGLSAYFVMSGPLAPLRAMVIDQQDVVTGEMPPGLAHLLSDLTGGPVALIGMLLGALIGAGALAPARFRSNGKAVFWSAVVALAIVSGWAGSYWVATTGYTDMPVVSHSFSAPVGESLLYAMTGSARAPSFAVGSVTGVILGAFVGSLFKGHFRWEACDDPRELLRQISGAALMGVGAVLALGCTIGQGISAFSVLAFSAPVTFLAIFAGAAFGLRQLIVGFQPAE